MTEALKQRLRTGDRVRITRAARDRAVWDRTATVVRYERVVVRLEDDTLHEVTPQAIEVIELAN